MRSVFITEDPRVAPPPQRSEAVALSELFTAMGAERYEAVYKRSTAETLVFLEDERASGAWAYNGVDLLWCHKLIVFENAFNAALCREALSLYLDQHRDVTIIVHKRPYGDIWSTPLWRVIEAGALGSSDRVRFAAGQETPPVGGPRSPILAAKNRLWPEMVRRGDWKKARFLMYADPDRSESVMRALGPERCGIYTRHRAPALWARALRTGTAFWQDACSVASDTATDSYRATLEARRVPRAYQDVLARLVNGHFAAAMDAVDSAYRLLETAGNLESVLLDEDISADKNAFCQAAALKGVRTAVECHGALADPRGFWPLTADSIFAWGNAQKKKLVSWGIPEHRVVVSGCSRYGRYQKLDVSKTRREVCRALRLDPSKKIVLMALFPLELDKFFFESTVRKTLAEMLEAVKLLPDVQFILKLHPGDRNAAWHAEWLERSGCAGRARLVRTFDPMILAVAADTLAVYHSTYAMDGLALGKPVVLIDDGQMRSPIQECESFGAFMRARSSGELAQSLRRLLADPTRSAAERERTLADCLNTPGPAPETVIARHLAGGAGRIPSVSVVMGTFNGERFIREQIDSIRAQTLTEWELIISDDASSDRTVRIAEEAAAADARIRVLRNERTLGVAKNFLKALAHARGRAIAYCDQDDLWRPDKLERLKSELDADPGCSLAYSELEIQNETMTAPGERFHRALALRPVKGRLAEKAFLKNTVPGCAMLFTRRTADAVLSVEPDASFLHDHLTLAVAAGLGRIAYVEEPLVRYRQHGANRVGTQPSAFDRERFARELGDKIASIRRAAIPGYTADLDRLERFREAYLSGSAARRALFAGHFIYLRNDRWTDRAKGVFECAFPRSYRRLKG